MAELSQYFGFLIIFKESFKLIFKNVKFMAAITLLSLLLSSLLVIVFCYIHQTQTNFLKTVVYDSSSYLPAIACILLFQIMVIIAIFAFTKIFKLLMMATTLVSATSYTDTVMSSEDLYSRIKTTSRRPQLSYRPSPDRAMGILATLVWMVVLIPAFFHPNPITITIAVVVGVSVFAFHLNASVATVLSMVVSVVEEKCEGSETLDKAEHLIEGQRYDGFMVNLFTYLPLLTLGFWLFLGDRLWSVGFWLILVNVFSLATMYGNVANTVLYFRCKEYHHEEVGGVGKFSYSKLPNSNVDANIP